MDLLNQVHIDTRWGYKTFELYQGDITTLDDGVDLLAISARAGGYTPVAGTVQGSLLYRHNISVKELLDDCEFDLRIPFSCWVSKPVQRCGIGRIVCVELFRQGFLTEEVVQNLFVVLSILEAKGIEVREFALPVLGAGLVGLDPGTVIRPLLRHAEEHFQRSQGLKRIRFVEVNSDRAGQLSRAMDDALGRVRVVLPKGVVADEIRRRILSHIDDARPTTVQQHSELLADLRRTVSDEQRRSFEIGIVGRRLLECIVDEVLKDDQPRVLYERIERVRKTVGPSKVAEWIVAYMHVLRVFGNEGAHEMDKSSRFPRAIDEFDVELGLLCIDQLLCFWQGLGAGGVLPV